jgi:beta-1,4-mannosyltransferase
VERPRSSTKPLLAIQYPDSKNPYTSLLRKALGEHGVAVQVVTTPHGFLRAALIGRKPDVLHLHWIHPVSRNLLLSIAKFCLFQAGLLLFRLRRVPIFWTIHNLEFHEKKYRWLDSLNNRMAAGMVDAAFVHGLQAIPLVATVLGVPAQRIYHTPHGNYVDAIPVLDADPFPRKQGEGISFLYFGQVRPYKGVVTLIEQFKRLEGPVSLTIAGDSQDAELRQQVEEAARQDARIHLKIGFLPDDELARLISRCDVVVLPFKEVLTSGSLVMAITWGKPVIVPRVGLIGEYVDESCALFYEACDDEGLFKALKAAIETDSNQLVQRGDHARALSMKLDWKVIGGKIAEVYRSYSQH